MAQLTPRDDIKKRVSEILKRVDQLQKAGNLQHALEEIERAKELDPRNVYVRAYEERVTHLISQQKQKAETEQKRQEEIRRKEAEEARRRAEEKQAKRLDEGRGGQTSDGVRFDGQRIHEALKRIRDETLRGKDTQVPHRKVQTVPPSAAVDEDSLKMYRKVLEDFWDRGAFSSEEQEQLKLLRISFSISDEVHGELEKEVQRESYSKALKVALSEKKFSPDSIQVAELRKQFRISKQEHNQLLLKLRSDIAPRSEKPKILLVDDDDQLLQLTAEFLEDAGYEVKALNTSDEAYALLQHYVPDLIVSDINLETSTMGGFSFYEKIREMERVNEIPFIFLSGLTDEILIRTGKELGVDDYITKPFSEETLLAVIKGKLRRYEQIRKNKKS